MEAALSTRAYTSGQILTAARHPDEVHVPAAVGPVLLGAGGAGRLLVESNGRGLGDLLRREPHSPPGGDSLDSHRAVLAHPAGRDVLAVALLSHNLGIPSDERPLRAHYAAIQP